MATAKWPEPKDRTLIGKRIDRMDGPVKSTGRAQYSYDVNLPGMLWARVHGSSHAHAKVIAIDTAPAESIPGVKVVWKDENLIGTEVQYIGQILAAVAAETEEAATEAVEKIKVTYEILDHQVIDQDPQFTEGRPTEREEGDVQAAFAASDVVVQGEYGIPVITHCCLESHGQVTSVRGDELYIWPSTQAVTGYADRLDEPTGIQRSKSM
jgi:xanthine dehydrogenase YagR molybdenum-binding subunit